MWSDSRGFDTIVHIDVHAQKMGDSLSNGHFCGRGGEWGRFYIGKAIIKMGWIK